MTDRELLELAAKAAGYRFVRWDEGRLVADIESKYPGFTEEWNPLQDDGDRMRLASALNMELMFGDDGCCVNGRWFDYSEHGGKDAAIGRAIVLAAAEIGREK